MNPPVLYKFAKLLIVPALPICRTDALVTDSTFN